MKFNINWQYVGIGFMIFIFIMFIISQIMYGMHDTIYEYNVIIDDVKYNFSEIELPENSLPYLQLECIQMCLEHKNNLNEQYCMKSVCLELGK